MTKISEELEPVEVINSNKKTVTNMESDATRRELGSFKGIYCCDNFASDERRAR
ncbi:MAG: hypothetical protein IH840_07640 [Candidatus Heimdallarchaeota archaeon]|nr:hypothetical protein [Candidatus Heimdallarchaeota archaeon]